MVGTRGRPSLSAVDVEVDGGTARIAADCLAVSGGFNPEVQLMGHSGARPVYDPSLAGFVFRGAVGSLEAAGAAAGIYDLSAALADGVRAANTALDDLGIRHAALDVPVAEPTPHGLAPAFLQPGKAGGSKAYVDFQHDVTAADVALAAREGYASVEHMKRYTTLGMATDQGRLSGVDGLAILAELKGEPIAASGVVLSRPPVVPLALGAVAGAHRGEAFRVVREVPVAAAARAMGAVFADTGLWRRPQYFPAAGETDWLTTVNREVLAVRTGVGVTDVSTLGKIEIEGPDAAAFLDRVYANRPSRILVGKARYAIMLREDGFLYDDGTVMRLADDHFVASVSTAHAAAAWRHLLFARQALFPSMRVALTAVSDAWAQFAVAGPLSGRALAAVLDRVSTSFADFPR